MNELQDILRKMHEKLFTSIDEALKQGLTDGLYTASEWLEAEYENLY